jgi:hypothetical protein
LSEFEKIVHIEIFAGFFVRREEACAHKTGSKKKRTSFRRAMTEMPPQSRPQVEPNDCAIGDRFPWLSAERFLTPLRFANVQITNDRLAKALQNAI